MRAGGESQTGRSGFALRCASPAPRTNATGSDQRRLDELRTALLRLGGDYDVAVRRGLRARDQADIAAGFDKADAIQRQMLNTLHQTGELERALARASAEVHQLPTPPTRHELPTPAPDDAA